jgi:hypothetical protein
MTIEIIVGIGAVVVIGGGLYSGYIFVESLL